ncbi:MAG TPA: dTDP-4-dehydrorhamnose 3,5-epimerase [Anaerolineales bacterium]|nr:dTDP-4-dehydrorhamnose 3,5-epimerase [Anaerolineales bacterium]HRF46151.1 dTDP-4-dehydrorhamnose 3,5-epimerase [Anaerolineales bacterium]
MKFRIEKTALTDVLVIETEYPRDERGFFIESFHQQGFRELGIPTDFVQDNHSRSRRGVLRGLHFQDLSAPQAKLVRCARGAVYDVVVDLRVGSPTFGQWVGVELNDENMRQILVPVGFGHGFVVLSEIADLHYKCSAYYVPGAEGSVAWDDPDLAIAWPVSEPILSARDRAAQSLRRYLERPAFRIE